MAKAYNVVALQTTSASKGVTKSGKSITKFIATLTVGGREIKRTVVAQGASAELLAGKLRKNTSIALRVVFDRASNNPDGTRGGEFLSVVGLPLAKTA